MEDNNTVVNIEGYSADDKGDVKVKADTSPEVDGYSSNIELMQAQIFVEKNIQLIERQTAEVQQENNEILKEEGVFGRIGEKIKGVAKEAGKEIAYYFRKNSRTLSRVSAAVLLGGMVYLTACTTEKSVDLNTTGDSKASSSYGVLTNVLQEDQFKLKTDLEDVKMTPMPGIKLTDEMVKTFTVQDQGVKETAEVKEIPEVDLTWDWEDFEGRFRMAPTVKEMEKSFKPEEGKSKYVIFGGAAGKLFDFDKTNPYSKDRLEDADVIKEANGTMELGLDEQGEEILKQMFLYQLQEGEAIEDQDVFVYIYVENGCHYEKSGPLTIIWQDGTIQVVSKENIPWDKIPSDVWDDIAAGNTKVDMSGDEVVCSCNVNDIRSSSNSTGE